MSFDEHRSFAFQACSCNHSDMSPHPYSDHRKTTFACLIGQRTRTDLIGHTRFSSDRRFKSDLFSRPVVRLSASHHLRTAGSIPSQTFWPFLPAVENCDDFETIASQPVGNHVRCARDDQLPRTGNSTRTAQVRQLGETFDSIEQCAGDSISGLWIILRDVRAKVGKVFDRPRRPDDDHARGAFRSRFRPHERSQFATSLFGTPRPWSSSLIPV